MKHAYAADPAPVLSVGSKRHVSAVVEEPRGDAHFGPACEDQVLAFHDLTRRLGRGGDEDGDLAEVEEHEGAVAAGEGLEGSVGEWAHLVEVPQLRELWRRRRWSFSRGWSVAATPFVEEEEEERSGEEQNQEM